MLLSAFSHQTEMRCNVIRPGPTIGPPTAGASDNSDKRFGQFIAAARRNEDIEVRKGDGRQFVAATDLAKVYAALLKSPVNRNTYLAVARDFITWEEIADLFVKALDSNSKVVVQSGSPAEPSLFHPSKIQEEFGLAFECRRAVEEHIRLLALA
jgi:UDP-glucose 4-epimerase